MFVFFSYPLLFLGGQFLQLQIWAIRGKKTQRTHHLVIPWVRGPLASLPPSLSLSEAFHVRLIRNAQAFALCLADGVGRGTYRTFSWK